MRDNRSLPEVLAEELRTRIMAGEWEPGEQLPSESMLVRETRLSRPTVRAALRILSSSGLILVRQGLGTFVRPRGAGVVAGLQELRSMSELIASQRPGSEVRYRMIERRQATAAEAARFATAEPLTVIALERCFVVGEAVIAFEWALLNASLLPDDFDHTTLAGSVFAMLTPLGLRPSQAIARVQPSNQRIEWPGFPTASDLFLQLSQEAFLPTGEVITTSDTYFTDGNFEFVIVRSR